MRYGLVIAIVISIIGYILYQNMTNQTHSNAAIQYVALGDSYTIGEGVAVSESFPSLLARHLNQNNIDIELVANPSATGYTTQDVIDEELPVFVKANPHFATLLIGANDYVRGVPLSTYKQNIKQILDTMEGNMRTKGKIVLVTIPDFSVTPQGRRFTSLLGGKPTIEDFNTVLKEEGRQRGLPVVDIFTLSQAMASNAELINADGLHPTGAEYALWEAKIFPVAISLLKK